MLTGSYPAFFISSFNPIKIFRGNAGGGSSGFSLRNVLVVFQFSISVVLVAGSLIINNQMDFIKDRKLGYNKENIINVPIFTTETKEKYETFKNEIVNLQDVLGVTATSFTPSVSRWREGTGYEGRTEESDVSFYRMSGDYNLIEVFGMEILEGRAFDKNFPSDLGNSYIMNEAAVNAVGWTKKIGHWKKNWPRR